MPFAAVVGLATLLSLLFWKEPKRIPWNPLTITWLLFVFWMSITTLFALVPDAAFREWDRSIKIQLMTLLTIMLMGTRQRVNSLIWVIVLSLGFFGIKGGVFALLTGGEYRVWGPPGSFIAGNNSLALALVMILPLMRYLQLSTSNRWVRYGLWVAMILTVLSILMSYSRGAFLAVSAMLVFLLLKSQRKITLMLVLLMFIPIFYSFVPGKWIERMETIQTYQEDGSALGRINAWWFAFNLAKDRPIVGGGYNAFDPNLFQRYAPDPDDFHDAHSIYFEVLGEHGFVGLSLFLVLGLLALRSGTWVIRHTKNRDDLKWAGNIASMCQVAILGYAVGGAFLGLAYFDLYYHLIAITIITRDLTEKALAEEMLLTSECC
jgi:probable O-glycosylation ligase (exosortase A-associated)